MTGRNLSGGVLAHPFVNYDRAVLSKGIIVTFYSNFTYSEAERLGHGLSVRTFRVGARALHE